VRQLEQKRRISLPDIQWQMRDLHTFKSELSMKHSKLKLYFDEATTYRKLSCFD
jgi:hypothetical protein